MDRRNFLGGMFCGALYLAVKPKTLAELRRRPDWVWVEEGAVIILQAPEMEKKITVSTPPARIKNDWTYDF